MSMIACVKMQSKVFHHLTLHFDCENDLVVLCIMWDIMCYMI